MADKKITELLAYANAIGSDLLPIVDITNGVTKKITITSLLGSRIFITVGTSNADYITDGVADDVQITAAIAAASALGGGIVYLKGTSYTLASLVVLKANVALIGSGVGITTVNIASSFADGVAMREQTGAATRVYLSDFTLNLSGKVDVGGIHIYQGDYVSLRRIRVTAQGYSSSSKWCVRIGNYTSGSPTGTISYGMIVEDLKIDNCNTGTFEQFLCVNQNAFRIDRPYFHANTNSNAYELMLYVNNKNGVINSPHFRLPAAHSIGVMESDGIQINNVTADYAANFNLVTVINSRNVLVDGVQGVNTQSSPTTSVFVCFDRLLGPDGFTQIVPDSEKCRFLNVNVDGWKSTLSLQTIGTVLGTDYTANQTNFEFDNITIKNQTVPFNIGADDSVNFINNFDFNNIRIVSWAGASSGAWQLRGQIGTVGAMYAFRFNKCFVASSTGGGSSAAIRNIAATVESVTDCDFSATFTSFGPLSIVSSGVFSKVIDVKGVNPISLYAQGNVTGSTTFTRVNGKVITATLTGNITMTMTAGQFVNEEVTLLLTQDGTGARTTTTPSNVKPANGGTLTLSPAASAVDLFTFIWDGTNWREKNRATSVRQPRIISMADATSFTPTGDTADVNTQTCTQVSGTLTANAPSGTPYQGQILILQVKCTNTQTWSWNAIFRSSNDVVLPTATTGSSKTDKIMFMYNSTDTKWDIMAKSLGY